MNRTPLALKVYGVVFYAVLAAPVVVVVLFSFNSTRSLQSMEGLSLSWYGAVIDSDVYRESLLASVRVAVAVMLIGTVLGTALAIGVRRSRGLLPAGAGILALIPLAIPEIALGVSALLLFSRVGIQFSLWTVVIAQVALATSFVFVVVRARLEALDGSAEEAAMDLGATPFHALRLIVLPALLPAIVSAALLVFALSFDDFVLSFFTTGEETQPLPVRIYSAIRTGPRPIINAAGTIMIAVTAACVLLAVLVPRLFGARRSGLASVAMTEGHP